FSADSAPGRPLKNRVTKQNNSSPAPSSPRNFKAPASKRAKSNAHSPAPKAARPPASTGGNTKDNLAAPLSPAKQSVSSPSLLPRDGRSQVPAAVLARVPQRMRGRRVRARDGLLEYLCCWNMPQRKCSCWMSIVEMARRYKAEIVRVVELYD